MILITIKDGTITASGLVPGQDILFEYVTKTYRIHRQGPVCHVHELDPLTLKEKGEEEK